MDLRDVTVRALKTGLQTALAVLTVEAFTDGLGDVAALATVAKAAGLAFVAGAFSVIHNAALTFSRS